MRHLTLTVVWLWHWFLLFSAAHILTAHHYQTPHFIFLACVVLTMAILPARR